ncbi:dihydrolipoyl dehydrogenase [Ochrobactrum sp. MYb15]|uniref:dihydrolipoyl dehydrogenase n=1 Tax=Brucella TaxID=234 RepID=UPI00046734C8|nr:dihydrolipoyl dehydrogenase [Brucella rhizosphaerae]PQZ48844.1 dihydrolipoyl dehydrogenase [Ochrobactrum sp. MYb19]PRA67338.1 dihydrolipoyl dehydrogenase [Ochrobactrum sp. MYb18]PRA77702.1 dihydrolipoyl dehydrogenase [Brucella thiophenivorans]PRA92348.1 dihydrolipoyl dehydrogenase [Ochrobactrum sp. MYb14]PRA99712.1 dihydrolipoyl dehydrogenase [Ochrobactrum sp. MYb15]
MSYDVVVIGTGPGGYVAAIKAAQLGLSVAVVEKRKTFGGTCLNVGCIPSKALLHASEVFAEAGHSFDTLGVEISKPKLNLEKMMAHKDATVKSNTSGVEFLFKKNKITPYIGTGKIVAKGKVSVTAEDGSVQEIEAKNIIIATGSDVAGIPGVKVDIDEKVILSSTGAIALDKVPGHLVVVGGGVIGLELGSVWARLGAKVTVVEYLDKVLGAMDGEVSKQFQRLLEKQGIVFKLGAKVTGVEKTGKGAKVIFEPVKGGDAETIDADAVLISTGRRPYTDGLGLAEAGVNLDDRGRVAIDGHWRTNVEGIYAIGDVVQGPMLAHKAEDEGIAVAEIIAGQAGHVNFDVIPSVVYTQPEVASVGKTEEELKAAGIEYKIGKFPFTANGRARAMLHTDGFVKILADKATDRVLGAHILGYNAGEMIHELAVLMEFGGSSEDLARTCHAHPTMSEAVRESALATFAKPIHM